MIVLTIVVNPRGQKDHIMYEKEDGDQDLMKKTTIPRLNVLP
jgi:hypothetical protein